MKPYISIPTAAEMLGVSRSTFMEIARDEHFEMITPNVHRRVLLADVHAYLRKLRGEQSYPAQSPSKYSENALAD